MGGYKKLGISLSVTFLLGAAWVNGQQAANPALPSSPAAPASNTSSSSSAPQSAPLKGFAEVTKEAESQPGFFTLWRKDDKVWLEIFPNQLDKPFFFSVNRVTGIGEQGITASTMLHSYLGILKKVGNSVQLLAQNNQFMPREGDGSALAVHKGFSDSLLAVAPVVSHPHPEKKSFLVEANALLLADIPSGATALETVYRQPYAFDSKNSSIEKFSVSEDQTSVAVRAHYALAKLVLSPLLAPGVPPPPRAPLPSNLPDVRSLFLTYQYNFSRLPEPMRPRLADPRVGHFVTTHWDYGNDLRPNPRVRYVNRWRLEKKDSSAKLSEPVQPIVFWLDDSIPLQYRDTVRQGVLEWNKAFERIGFKDAITVKQKGVDGEVEVMDARHASISWYLATDASSAVGPSQVDLRTGEILDADIRIADIFTRSGRRTMLEQRPQPAGLQDERMHQEDFCNLPYVASAEMDFALELLSMRQESSPDDPEVDAVAKQYLKEVVTHEVGHTLGLRHNFRSSTIYSLAQLQDKDFTRQNGTAGSVMDYTPFNLNLQREPASEYVMTSLGPYDYWAIEYAYKPLAPETEASALAKIAGRSHEPQLAYATDEDAGDFAGIAGMDPEVNRFDLGNNPLAYYQRRFQLSQELWGRLQNKVLAPDQDYTLLRRVFDQGLRYAGMAAKLTAKYVGGVVHLRDFAGTGRLPLTPVRPVEQREALKILTENIFSTQNFHFNPDFMRRLVADQFDRTLERITPLGEMINTDFSLSVRIATLQKEILDQLLAGPVAVRILDAETKVSSPEKVFQLSELYSALQNAIWSEVKQGRDVSAMRRNLQQEHLKHLVTLLTKPTGNTPPDAKALARDTAKGLLADLGKVAKKSTLSKDTKAHYADVANTLQEALAAPFQRIGV